MARIVVPLLDGFVVEFYGLLGGRCVVIRRISRGRFDFTVLYDDAWRIAQIFILYTICYRAQCQEKRDDNVRKYLSNF